MNNDELFLLRREYGEIALDETKMAASPMAQFHLWFDEACQGELDDPSAMVLSTVDAEGRADARVVLLKGILDEKFVFYTNYASTKALEMAHNQSVALTFYWPKLARQVRVRGTVSRVEGHVSDAYFATRPYESQISAIASLQSRVIESREELELVYQQAVACYPQQSVTRPESWGGYAVLPSEFEFWQGRNSRLHDRIRYALTQNNWEKSRLYP